MVMGARAEDELLRLAADRGVSQLVDLLRQAKNLGWGENFESTFGGSFRYTVAIPPDRNALVLVGINVAGEFAPPLGSLDVWVRPTIAAAYSKTSEESVFAELRQFECVQNEKDKYFVRVSDTSTATQLFEVLKEWHSSSAA
jgi:hypothetical protein